MEGYSRSMDSNGRVDMNKKELVRLHAEVDEALRERRALGEYNADSKHMLLLLGNMRELIAHAISQASPEKK